VVSGQNRLPGRQYASLARHPKNTVATCGFSDQLAEPKLGNATVVKAVTSTAEIPGYLTADQIRAEARTNLNDPSVTKTILQGRLALSAWSNGPEGLPTIEIIDNPILFHFKTGVPTTLIG
jgi:hypothetical protein